MGVNSGKLRRLLRLQRAEEVIGPGGVIKTEWVDHGPLLFATRHDVSDAERNVAAHWQNKLVSRFIVRSSNFTRYISRSDRLMSEGIIYEIDGIKEVPPGRAFIEITAWTEETA